METPNPEHMVPYYTVPQLARLIRENDRVRADADRFRAMITEAPHAGDCGLNETGYNNQPIGLPCTCWKADAL